MFREGEFSIGYEQCDNDWESGSLSNSLRKDLRNAIMTRSNDRALALLQKFGYIGCVEGIGNAKISIAECADFYGITHGHLRAIIGKNQLRKRYPDDAQEVVPGKTVKVEYLGCKGEIEKAVGKRVLLTPRFVLMVAMYMAPSGKECEISRAREVLIALKRSTYRFPLVSDPAVGEAKEEPVAQTSPVPAIVPEQADQIEQTEKPVVVETVMLSPEFFGKMVMSAAMELVKSRERA